jgi:hypothetical protein
MVKKEKTYLVQTDLMDTCSYQLKAVGKFLYFLVKVAIICTEMPHVAHSNNLKKYQYCI